MFWIVVRAARTLKRQARNAKNLAIARDALSGKHEKTLSTSRTVRTGYLLCLVDAMVLSINPRDETTRERIGNSVL